MRKRLHSALTGSARVRARAAVDPFVRHLRDMVRALDAALSGHHDPDAASQLGKLVRALRIRCGLDAPSAPRRAARPHAPDKRER